MAFMRWVLRVGFLFVGLGFFGCFCGCVCWVSVFLCSPKNAVNPFPFLQRGCFPLCFSIQEKEKAGGFALNLERGWWNSEGFPAISGKQLLLNVTPFTAASPPVSQAAV